MEYDTRIRSVRQISWSTSSVGRAGVIPICEYTDELWFGFTLSKTSGFLSDFGGVIESKDYDLLCTALREFSEESSGVFGAVGLLEVIDCPVITSTRTIEIFYRVSGRPWDYTEAFQAAGTNGETMDIVWLTMKQLLFILANNHNKGPYISRAIAQVLTKNIHLISTKLLDPIVSNEALKRVPFEHKVKSQQWNIKVYTHPDAFNSSKTYKNYRKFITIKNDHVCGFATADGKLTVCNNRALTRQMSEYFRQSKHNYVALDSDIAINSKLLGDRITSLESLISDIDTRKRYIEIIKEHRRHFNPVEAAINELKVMVRFETINFEYIKSKGIIDKTYYDFDRATCHFVINTINKVLAEEGQISIATLKCVLNNMWCECKRLCDETVTPILSMLCRINLLKSAKCPFVDDVVELA